VTGFGWASIRGTKQVFFPEAYQQRSSSSIMDRAAVQGRQATPVRAGPVTCSARKDRAWRVRGIAERRLIEFLVMPARLMWRDVAIPCSMKALLLALFRLRVKHAIGYVGLRRFGTRPFFLVTLSFCSSVGALCLSQAATVLGIPTELALRAGTGAAPGSA